MRARIFLCVATVVTLVLIPEVTNAHFEARGGGFSIGFFHPVLGYDHLLAMVCVGVLSAQIGGRAIWTMPATFVAVMTLGGALGMANIKFPMVEYGIVFSVVVLGSAIAAGKKMNIALAHCFVGLFASFHGHAHGTEMPMLADPALYALGFLLSTACLHLFGVLIGLLAIRTSPGVLLLRNGGAVIAAFGLYLIIVM